MTSPLLELSASFSDNARTRPILDGAVKTAGLRLYCTELHPSEMFWRQLHFQEFDVSEMSIASLLISATRGDYTWAAVPIFTYRKFFHTSILVNKTAGIEQPSDLKGKRVGVPEYQQTWAVWSRGVLKDEFGVQPSDMTWFMERGADRSHGAATGFQPPAGVSVNGVDPGDTIGQMLARGDLDATLLQLNQPNLVDRGRTDTASSAAVRPLFADPVAEGARYYAKTGIYPVNHVVVVRRALLDRHPWIALNLLESFNRAKDQALQTATETLRPYQETGANPAEPASASARDPMAYGFKANRATLETLARYLTDQGLLQGAADLTGVFASSTLEV